MPLPFKKRFKREYRKMIDRMIRSHALHTLALRLVYFICFVVSLILATLLYFEK
jgi:hypothetical protein